MPKIDMHYWVVARTKYYDILSQAFCDCLFGAKLKRAEFLKRMKDPEGQVRIYECQIKEVIF